MIVFSQNVFIKYFRTFVGDLENIGKTLKVFVEMFGETTRFWCKKSKLSQFKKIWIKTFLFILRDLTTKDEILV